MRLVLDVENTVTERGGKLHLDPFEETNTLVMVGLLNANGDETIVTFDHSEREPTPNGHEIVQKALDDATIIIGHNIAYDLVWLWESGFKYDGSVFDTMLGEYVLQRGLKKPLSLDACAERYELDTQKQTTLKEYFKKGYTTRDIPHSELSEYLSADLHATKQLSDKLYIRLNTKEDSTLMDTVLLTNEVACCLARIYSRGFEVDVSALDGVRQEFEKEKKELQKALYEHVRKLMGDTPINLNSPEQLSWVIYGRKVIDKTEWANSIHPYMSETEFRKLVNIGTEIVYKTDAKHCNDCNGTGYITKTKKDGKPFANPSRCKTCDNDGYIFKNRSDVAGLKFKPPSPKWASANGFSTSKQNLEILERASRAKGMTDSVDFLYKVRRLSAVDTYLSSFVEGIATHVKKDNKLHVRLLQHRTSTGRFSGADPNMQNMPRGGTFPVKRVFISRWKGGKILEADFAQLEFRTAAYLSQDGVAIEEVTTGFDVHSYTSKVITDAGQPTSRQDAKAHTFAPLYGATGFGRSKAEAAYYKHFTEKYQGIKSWHSRLATEALTSLMIKTPSGREFSFPNVVRKKHDTVSYFTQIKNYPVQSFATADIVPIALLYIDKLLDSMKSCVVNTVHDSIVIDVHPDEERAVLEVINTTNRNLTKLINTKWNIDFNVPLLLESKIGYNWLDTKDVS
jgi:DNA polymerase I-like protein with 3'-5' exonuclease and polymerase domains|tara:strand:+ start:3476 stop:5518 length:2043 start_codon:yes stop_codon:yes gene_type:complete